MREIKLTDHHIMANIHANSFAKSWSAEEFAEILKSGAHGWIIDQGAFLLIRNAADEAEIMTVATLPQHRRKGYAYQLLTQAQKTLKQQQITALFLEVQHDNEAAIHLYKKLGFQQTGRRRNYYTLPNGDTKDAVVMRASCV